MNNASPSESDAQRFKAALGDYFERVDRGEPFDPERFISDHPEVSDELRTFINAEKEFLKLATSGAPEDPSAAATGVFRRHSEETLAPRAPLPGAKPQQDSGLSGLFGRYRILRALGKGSMGSVFLAEDSQLMRQVAIKTPRFMEGEEGEALERFYREARAAATLRHANICPVYDVGQIDGTHYISMAYIDGLPLSDFIQPTRLQDERQILLIIRKLARAVQEAHDHGIVHRDLKPANIMVDNRGEPIIMDFGLARQAQEGETTQLTLNGTLIGSPAYMSPEQVEGDQSKVGPATDQYSLGVVFYELLTGRLPFSGPFASVMSQIVSKEPTPPRQFRANLEPRVEALCLKMMAKQASNRFASLAAVADEITTILRGPSSAAVPPPPRGTPWKIVAGAAGLVSLLAAGTIFYLRAGKAVVEVEINDPNIEATLSNSTVTFKGRSITEVKVEPGENQLTITHDGLTFKTAGFSLEKGHNQLVKVTLKDATVQATFGGAPLALTPTGGVVQNAQTATSNGAQRKARTDKIEVASSPRPAAAASPAARPDTGEPVVKTFPLFVPFNGAQAKKGQAEWAAAVGTPVDMTDSIGIKLKVIPPGEFVMGGSHQHSVRLTHAIYMGVYEVTRGQFARFTQETRYATIAEYSLGGVTLENTAEVTRWYPNKKYTWRDPGFPQQDDHPVVQLAWGDAVAFCEWLSRKENATYRLPTEAEWEYACRAGTYTRSYIGNDLEEETKIGNVADAAAKAVFPKWEQCLKTSDGYVFTGPVGRFQPNNFGLYDTIGNASEWCSDWFEEDYYDHAPTVDPPGPAGGATHVFRGGGFTAVPGCRFRYHGVPQFRRPDLGFRVVRAIGDAKNRDGR